MKPFYVDSLVCLQMVALVFVVSSFLVHPVFPVFLDSYAVNQAFQVSQVNQDFSVANQDSCVVYQVFQVFQVFQDSFGVNLTFQAAEVTLDCYAANHDFLVNRNSYTVIHALQNFLVSLGFYAVNQAFQVFLVSLGLYVVDLVFRVSWVFLVSLVNQDCLILPANLVFQPFLLWLAHVGLQLSLEV